MALFKLTLVGLIVAFVAMYPGEMHLHWLGYDVELPMAAALAIFVVLLGLMVLLYHTWRYLTELPKRVRRVLAQRRYQKGERLLLEGLTAIAAQQPEEAAECVEFAKSLLPDHPLTVFVAAQSAHLAKDHQQAREYFYEMTRSPRLAFLGYRGLVVQAQEQKDWRRASELLSHAFRLRPDSPWVIHEMLRTHIMLSQQELIPATKTLPIYRYIPKDDWRRHEALSLWLQTEHVAPTSHTYGDLLHKAHQLAPALVMIALKRAEYLIAHKDAARAQKVIIQTYKIKPHRYLATLWLSLKPELHGVQRYQFLEKLTKYQPDHVESLWALAHAAFEAQLWGQARAHLESLLEEGDVAQACMMMAQVIGAESPHREDLIAHWQERFHQSNQKYVWSCQTCQHVHAQWAVTCSYCQGIDTIDWRLINAHDESQALLTYD